MRFFTLLQILNVITCTIAFTNIAITTKQVHRLKKSTELWGFFDDLFKRTPGGDLNDDKDKQPRQDRLGEDAAISKPNDEMGFSEKDLRNEIERRKAADNLSGQESNVITSVSSSEGGEEREFDGYMLRDAIYSKWGECYDLEFQPVVTFGFRELYLNVMPFRLGGKRFRHKTELDYLCHLQAVVEILEKYDRSVGLCPCPIGRN